MPTITIKELHRATGAAVRRAGASRLPTVVTDHGTPVAMIMSLALVKRPRRKRVLLPGFKNLMMKEIPGSNVQEDLNAIRGDR